MIQLAMHMTRSVVQQVPTIFSVSVTTLDGFRTAAENHRCYRTIGNRSPTYFRFRSNNGSNVMVNHRTANLRSYR